jgi:hypothetical protein
VDPEVAWSQMEGLMADGHRPTFKTYTALMTCLGDLGAPEDAEEVGLSRHLQNGCYRTVVTERLLQNGCCRTVVTERL